MKKCPACNSSKYRENLVDGNPIKSCSRCGFVNKSDLEINNNEVEGQLSLDNNIKK